MGFRCLLGMHSYGLPRTNGDGTVSLECMSCLRVETSPITLPEDEGAAAALNVRRAQAIAELVAEERWVGLPSNPSDTPLLGAVETREEPSAASVLIPRPRAA
jgi:hypothetical protein